MSTKLEADRRASDPPNRLMGLPRGKKPRAIRHRGRCRSSSPARIGPGARMLMLTPRRALSGGIVRIAVFGEDPGEVVARLWANTGTSSNHHQI